MARRRPSSAEHRPYEFPVGFWVLSPPPELHLTPQGWTMALDWRWDMSMSDTTRFEVEDLGGICALVFRGEVLVGISGANQLGTAKTELPQFSAEYDHSADVLTICFERVLPRPGVHVAGRRFRRLDAGTVAAVAMPCTLQVHEAGSMLREDQAKVLSNPTFSYRDLAELPEFRDSIAEICHEIGVGPPDQVRRFGLASAELNEIAAAIELIAARCDEQPCGYWLQSASGVFSNAAAGL